MTDIKPSTVFPPVAPEINITPLPLSPLSPLVPATIISPTPGLLSNIAAPIKIFLLPGLDGTGQLLEELCFRLKSKKLDPIIVSYPHTPDVENWGYEAYADYVSSFIQKNTLPHESFALMAESFSGPIVAHIYPQLKSQMTHIVFVASFVKNPIIGASILQKISLDKIENWLAQAHADNYGTNPPRQYHSGLSNSANKLAELPSLSAIPLKLLTAGALGFKATPRLSQQLKHVALNLPPRVIVARVKMILNLDNKAYQIASFQAVPTPILYISGRFDTLILPHAYKTIKNNNSNTQTVKLSAPHFVNQTLPREVSFVISEFINNKKLENVPFVLRDLLPNTD